MAMEIVLSTVADLKDKYNLCPALQWPLTKAAYVDCSCLMGSQVRDSNLPALEYIFLCVPICDVYSLPCSLETAVGGILPATSCRRVTSIGNADFCLSAVALAHPFVSPNTSLL